MMEGAALVTGGGSGIGQACAIQFVQDGCRKVAIADLSLAPLKETVNRLKALGYADLKCKILCVDIRQEENVEGMVSETVKDFGRLDYAVNAAGISSNGLSSTEETPQGFDTIMAVNLRGAWLCSRYQLAQMKRQAPLPSRHGTPGTKGSIVHIASQLGIVSISKSPVYCASKSGLISLTRTDAIDYAMEGIRVNCVCPGVIDTPMARAATNTEIAPMKRKGLAEEVADVVVFLASNRSSFVTGHAMVVDGGYICS